MRWSLWSGRQWVDEARLISIMACMLLVCICAHALYSVPMHGLNFVCVCVHLHCIVCPCMDSILLGKRMVGSVQAVPVLPGVTLRW